MITEAEFRQHHCRRSHIALKHILTRHRQKRCIVKKGAQFTHDMYLLKYAKKKKN